MPSTLDPDIAAADSLSDEELEAQLAAEEEARGVIQEPKSESEVEPKPEAKVAEPKAQVTPQAKPQETKQADPEIEALKRQLTAISKELGQSRQVQSELAKMKALLEKNQTAQAKSEDSTLSPQQQAAEKYLAEFFKKQIEQQFGPLLKYGQAQMEATQTQQVEQAYMNDLKSMASRDGIENFDEFKNTVLKGIVDELRKQAEESNQNLIEQAAAKAELDRIIGPGGQYYLYHLGGQKRQAEALAKNQEIQTARAKKGEAASATFKPQRNTNEAPKKSLTEMSQAELDRLPMKELEARLKAENAPGFNDFAH